MWGAGGLEGGGLGDKGGGEDGGEEKSGKCRPREAGGGMDGVCKNGTMEVRYR